ncbi:maestro heat-like repeat-containing protein family member 7 isoform X2 [Carettochelys insculpta]|uniref:maestro heat-like repeat-containing protein family member 7 isoform X2 n=1 Tax=Carettochelys insculpta TaxID=44489 RepID=UPI003EB83EC8
MTQEKEEGTQSLVTGGEESADVLVAQLCPARLKEEVTKNTPDDCPLEHCTAPATSDKNPCEASGSIRQNKVQPALEMVDLKHCSKLEPGREVSRTGQKTSSLPSQKLLLVKQIVDLYNQSVDALEVMLRALLSEKPTPAELQNLLDHLAPWMTSEKAHERLRAVSTSLCLLQAAAKHPKFCLSPEFPRLGLLIGRLALRVGDPEKEIGCQATEGLYFLHALMQSQKEPRRKRGPAIAVLHQISKEKWGSYEPTRTGHHISEIVQRFGQFLSPEQVTDLLLTAVESLKEASEGTMEASKTILNVLLEKYKWKIQVPKIVGKIHSQLRALHHSHARQVVIMAVCLLACAFMEEVSTALLKCPLPLDSCVVKTVKTLLLKMGCHYEFTSVEKEGGWELLTSSEEHHRGVGLLARAMVHYSCCELWRILYLLVPFLERGDEQHRLTAMAFFVELLHMPQAKRLPKKYSVVRLLNGLTDPDPVIRALCVKGLITIADWPGKEVKVLVPAMINSLCGVDGRLVVEALADVKKILRGPDGASYVDCITSPLRVLFDDERLNVRSAAISLFGKMVKKVKKSQGLMKKEEILDSLIPLLLHLQEGNPDVAEASSYRHLPPGLNHQCVQTSHSPAPPSHVGSFPNLSSVFPSGENSWSIPPSFCQEEIPGD